MIVPTLQKNYANQEGDVSEPVGAKNAFVKRIPPLL